jgi:hypothetical protein
VVQTAGQAGTNGDGEKDRAVAQVQTSVADVGELQGTQLPAGQPMEGGQSTEGGSRRVGGVEDVAQDGRGEQQRVGGLRSSGGNLRGGVGEDHLAGFEDFEDRPQDHRR